MSQRAMTDKSSGLREPLLLNQSFSEDDSRDETMTLGGDTITMKSTTKAGRSVKSASKLNASGKPEKGQEQWAKEEEGLGQDQNKVAEEALPKPATPEDDALAGIEIAAEDDIPNFTDKCIDFNAQLEAYKKRTTSSLPYTLTQVEDAMFLDKDNIVTLEYHYYQNDCKYSTLDAVVESIDLNGNLIDGDGERISHKLGTENYQKNEKKPHPMSAFDRQEVVNYSDDQVSIVQEQRELGPEADFFRVDSTQEKLKAMTEEQILKMMAGNKKKKRRSSKKSNDQMIEGIIALYKVTSGGGLQRNVQDTVRMGRKFFPSKDGNMVLTRSKDKKIISLTNFDRYDEDGNYFKIRAWTTKLGQVGPDDNFRTLEHCMNMYFEKNRSTFDELIEVSFVGGNLAGDLGRTTRDRYVQLMYLETRKRELKEQQEYERLMSQLKEKIEANGGTVKDTERLQDGFRSRNTPRKAKKYVFFDIFTGQIVFEYGGVQTQMRAQNSAGQEVDIYELGCLVQEIKEESFEPKICIYFAGDFMAPEVKEKQKIFKWAMNYISLSMKTLFDMGAAGGGCPENQLDLIQTSIKSTVGSPLERGCLNYYPFRDDLIKHQKFNWEQNIQVATCRNFQQIAILNLPVDRDEYNVTSFYVHGPKWKEALNDANLKQKNYLIDVPYHKQLPSDATYRHSRNHNIKDQLFYDQIKGTDVKTFCLRLDSTEPGERIVCPKLPMGDFVSQHDIWLHFKKDFANQTISPIYQTIHVSTGDQTGVLQTEIPKSNRILKKLLGKQFITKKTSTFYQQSGDLPIIAYNLGDSKICLQNTLQMQDKKMFILELKEDEKFVCFIKFNAFQDIGFYPKDLKIECCSHFAFLTSGIGKNAGNMKQNRLNLILMDPFFSDTQVARFQSNLYVNNDIFLENDSIITSVIQSSKIKTNDKNFKIYMWTQFPQKMIRSRFLKVVQPQGQLAEVDSDVESGEEGEGDMDDITQVRTFEPVRMFLDNKNFLYYVIKQNGKCHVIEGNPRDPYVENHEIILSIKAEKCLALTVDKKGNFYFMDQDFISYKASRNDNNRQLQIVSDFTMNEIQTLDFKPREFDSVIMNGKYALQGNKIFYLYDYSDEPFPEGIMESEDIFELLDKKSGASSRYIKGPTEIQGSMRFFNVYQKKKFSSFIIICQKPDSTTKTLINDYLNQVDMSTFLEDGKILMKIGKRFMVFTSNGAFIDETEFNDEILARNNMALEPELSERSNQQLQTARHVKGDESNVNVEKLKARRWETDPILDFEGKEYEFKEPEGRVPLDESTKLEILNMSYNNKWFLFYNRKRERLCLYELQQKQLHPDQPQKLTFQFVLTHDLDTDNSFMFIHMHSKDVNVDPIAYFRANVSQIQIDDKGTVKLCYVENLPITDVKTIDSQDPGLEVSNVDIRLLGAIFTPEKGVFQVKSQCFLQVMEFPRDAQDCLVDITAEKKQILDRTIKQVALVQARLPKKLFDYSQYDNLIEDLVALEGKKPDYIQANIYGENLVVLYCGKYVKFGKLLPNLKKPKKASMDVMDLVLEPIKTRSKPQYLQDMSVTFGDTVEVIKVIETNKTNCLQLVSVDHSNGIYSILSWDFDQNIEQNLMQTVPDPSDDVAYHVVKGMNKKMNYLINQNHMIDLEYNIPLRQTSVNQNLDPTTISYTKQLNNITDMFNQRKVFQDGAKFLGIERSSVLFYPLSRMNLVLWQSIHAQGEDPELIYSACDLDSINIVIEGNSLFHYFADNAELIEQIHQKYIFYQQNNLLSAANKLMPLQCLNPDTDGKTALYLSVKRQSPASFECMVEMLIDFPDQCLSKMMLKSLALILSHESENVINYFEAAIFQPPQMQMEQFIPWNDDLDEFVFPSHTSVISRDLLVGELKSQGIDDGNSPPPVKKKKGDNSEPTDSIAKRKQIIKSKKNLRSTALEATFDTGLPAGQKPLKRVQVEALDMDWLFVGDNSKILLRLLANEANNQTLVKKSIKTFVDLMWTHYQPAIVRKIFFPYLVYLFAIMQLSSRCVNELFLYAATSQEAEPPRSGNSTADEAVDAADGASQGEPTTGLEAPWLLKAQFFTFISIAIFFMVSFASLEIEQMVSDGFGYFEDPWNCIDMTSICTNAFYLYCCLHTYVTGEEKENVNTINMYGSFAVFFMWIKVFYWMRLFASLAYYVKLIMQTISDSIPFMAMMLIILCAFANFFYVANQNIEYSGDNTGTGSYFSDFVGIQLIDVMISMYLLGALGDFDPTAYAQGPDSTRAQIMFLLATFIICVVFMNMLIAIMGDTFGKVSEAQVESGIRERVVLISDHAWLLDLQKIFKGKRYVIRVRPSSGAGEERDPTEGAIDEVEAELQKKIGRVQSTIHKRVDSVDLNTRFLLDYQQKTVDKVLRKIKEFESRAHDFFHQSDEEDDEDGQPMSPEKKQENKLIKNKKAELLKAMNKQTSDRSLTIESVGEIAMKWMELADQNGDGELDLKEFTEFFSRLDGFVVSDDEIRAIFEDFDGSGNKKLSVEEFARAIHQIVLADQEEEVQDVQKR